MGRGGERDEALEKALALKDRVTLPERLEIEAWYFTFAGANEARVLDALEQLVRHYPRRAIFRRALADVYLRNGRFDAALAAGGTSPGLHYILFQSGLATEDDALKARARAWAERNPAAALRSVLEADAEDAMSRGRLKHALALLSEWEASAAAAGQPRQATILRLRMARYEALCGLRAEALGRVEAERQRGLDSG